MRHLKTCGAIVLAIGVAGGPAESAQNIVQPWETLPSFKPNQVFHSGPIDDVSLFSGDAQISVPLGPEFTLSPGVKWQLSARYSSKMWHMWSQDCNAVGCTTFLSRARLGGNSALGAGWTLELGHIIAGSSVQVEDPRPRYRSPAGGITFISMPAGGGYGTPDDNSFVRFSSQPFWTMQRPDGTTWEFTHSFYAPSSPNNYDYCDDDRVNSGIPRYGLERVRDRFNNVVLTVTYDAQKPWQVKNVLLSNGQSIDFTWGTFQRQGSSYAWPVLSTISFSSVGGNPLTVTFSRFPDGRIGRSPFEQGSSNWCPSDPTRSTIDGPLLSRIDVGGHFYDFTYAANEGTGYETLVSTYTLPTGGRVEYDWLRYTVLKPCVEGNQGCNPESDSALQQAVTQDTGDSCSSWRMYLQNFIDASPSVISRREIDPFGGLTRTTSYSRKQFGGKAQAGPLGDFDVSLVMRQAIVVRPDGNGGSISSKHLFNHDGAELERRHYPTGAATGAPLRSEIFCYDGTNPAGKVCGAIDASRQEPQYYSKFVDLWAVIPIRRSREVTWYGTNPQPGGSCLDNESIPCRFISRSEWIEGAREFRVERIGLEYTTPSYSSAMAQPGFLRRETTTNWTPARVSPAWMPKIADSVTVQDVHCQSEPCNSVTFGYCPSELAPCDHSKSLTYDTSGNLTFLSISDTRTGYAASVSAGYTFTGNDPTTETVTGSGSVTGSLSTTRTYQGPNLHQVLTAKRNPFTFFSFDVDREAPTGLITASRDANSALVTTYTYDNLGRLKKIEAPGELKTTICYKDPSGSTPAYALVKRTSSDTESVWCDPDAGQPVEGGGPVEAYGYDGFGRLIREVRKLPNLIGGGSLAFRATLYNSAGYVSDETEWQPCGTNQVGTCMTVVPASGKRATYSNFDFKGRWRYRVAADSSSVDRSFDDPAPIWNSDTAELVTLHEVNAAAGSGSGSLAYTAKRSDFLNRLFVTSLPGDTLNPVNPPGFSFRAGPYTSYLWNTLDRVSKTTQESQGRRFDYDKLGNLRSETHPESGATTYSSFDVLGNVLSRTEADGRVVAATYDNLGRLVTVDANSLNYRHNYYDGSGFSGGIYKLGRLTRQVSSNPGSLLENATVEEDYSFSGLGGRLSARTTRLKRSSQAVLLEPEQSFFWNNLGLLQTHVHARVSGSFSTDTYYTSGLPTRLVNGSQTIVSGATYSAFGGLQSYTTGDGVQTIFTPDATGMSRPSAITTSGVVPAAANFNTGTISYDGVGNIRQMQLSPSGPTDSFTYDLAGRLRKATWGTLGSGINDDFVYDNDLSGLHTSGNITRKGVDVTCTLVLGDPCTPLDVNAATNRLTTGTYGPSGEIRTFGPKTYAYDGLLRQVRFSQSGSVEHSLFGADDERLARVVPTAAVPETVKATRLFTLSPCRLYDTRNSTALVPGVERTVQASGICGVPSNATALAANVTSINASAENGSMRAYPAGISFRPLMTANAIRGGRTRGMMNIIELGDPNGTEPGKFRLLSDMPSASLHALVDVSGYFAPVSTATGNSWYVTLRDNDHRLSTEYRWDESGNVMNLLSDHIYLGSIRVATVGTSATEGVPLGLTYYSTDHLGTPRLAHTTGGQLVASYRYRSFGEPYTGSGQTPGTATTQGLGFALMERDALSGDHYDHARFYSGYTGRFNSPDVLRGRVEDPQSWNRYAYARNNPLKYVDPDGRSA
ncbi:MAG TPA: RHS repeat-associated core domain-containing protein, partial [Thermoanaerobaculia bacterium]|nr:RHS repeat-associated core domain-containing protein [Thermoanaerobaculia bacterium]